MMAFEKIGEQVQSNETDDSMGGNRVEGNQQQKLKKEMKETDSWAKQVQKLKGEEA